MNEYSWEIKPATKGGLARYVLHVWQHVGTVRSPALTAHSRTLEEAKANLDAYQEWLRTVREQNAQETLRGTFTA